VRKRYLLDVNALVGLLWSVHALHARANAWFAREAPVVLGCAMTELSFIRVSMADRTIAATLADAETALALFVASPRSRYRFIDASPPAAVLRGRPLRSHKEVSDLYLCELAAANGARLATLDTGIQHPAAVAIA
jgi:predicted nucleic acid-binding protein